MMTATLDFLKLIRLSNLLMIVFTQYMVRWCLIYPILYVKGLELQMSEVSFFFLVLSTVMIGAAGYIINDYFDLRIDRINKPEKIIIGKTIDRRVALICHFIFNIIAISIGLILSYQVGFWKLSLIYFIWAGGLWYYSTNFKYQLFTGNLLIALFTFLIPLVAGIFELLLLHKNYSISNPDISFKDIWTWLLGFSLFAFIINLLREIIKDMEDFQGDKEYGCKTIPIALGINTAKTIAIGITCLIIIFLTYLQIQQFKSKDMLSFFYFLLTLQTPLLIIIALTYKAKTKKNFKFVSSLTKLTMISGISYLFIFCISLLFL